MFVRCDVFAKRSHYIEDLDVCLDDLVPRASGLYRHGLLQVCVILVSHIEVHAWSNWLTILGDELLGTLSFAKAWLISRRGLFPGLITHGRRLLDVPWKRNRMFGAVIAG